MSYCNFLLPFNFANVLTSKYLINDKCMLISKKKKKKFNPRVNIRKMQRTLKLVNYSNNNGRMINVHRVNPFNIIN